jgi:ferritin-like metal-binding protein YciE
MFLTKIQVLYDVEKQLEKALPKLQKAANSLELKDGFAMHLEETKNHSVRLERIFEMLGAKPKKLESEGIRGIISDGGWVIDVNAPPDLKDKMLAGAARYAEHYEMAGYMTAIIQADDLGLEDVSDLLNETLTEEEEADATLATVLEKSEEGGDEEESEDDMEEDSEEEE